MRKALWILIADVAILAVTGLLVLFSASGANGVRLYGDPIYFLKRQLIYLTVGVFIAFVVAKFDYHQWRKIPFLTIAFYIGVLLLLGWVLTCDPINGSRRWINLKLFRLQPSELAKISTVIAVGVWIDKSGWRVETLVRGILIPLLILFVPAVLTLAEPDFGAVMVMGATIMVLLLMAGVNFWYWLSAVVLGGVAFFLNVALNANRMARFAATSPTIYSFLHPISEFMMGLLNISSSAPAAVEAAAKRASYQTEMSIVAIQRGGIFGVGMNQSMQKHAYLPESHTDFIFAVGAEEWGLLFSIFIILLFLTFWATSLYIGIKSEDRLGRFFAIALSFIIFFQAIFNLGVVCEALPTKGVALPFFSYGGTNLISAFLIVGTIISVALHSGNTRGKNVIRNSVRLTR